MFDSTQVDVDHTLLQTLHENRTPKELGEIAVFNGNGRFVHTDAIGLAHLRALEEAVVNDAVAVFVHVNGGGDVLGLIEEVVGEEALGKEERPRLDENEVFGIRLAFLEVDVIYCFVKRICNILFEILFGIVLFFALPYPHVRNPQSLHVQVSSLAQTHQHRGAVRPHQEHLRVRSLRLYEQVRRFYHQILLVKSTFDQDVRVGLGLVYRALNVVVGPVQRVDQQLHFDFLPLLELGRDVSVRKGLLEVKGS